MAKTLSITTMAADTDVALQAGKRISNMYIANVKDFTVTISLKNGSAYIVKDLIVLPGTTQVLFGDAMLHVNPSSATISCNTANGVHVNYTLD